MSSSDKHKHKTLSANAEIIKKLDKGEKLVNLAKSMVLDILYGIWYEEKQREEWVRTLSSNLLFSVIRQYLGPIYVRLPRLYCTHMLLFLGPNDLNF
jgi:hypothetical protein